MVRWHWYKYSLLSVAVAYIARCSWIECELDFCDGRIVLCFWISNSILKRMAFLFWYDFSTGASSLTIFIIIRFIANSVKFIVILSFKVTTAWKFEFLSFFGNDLVFCNKMTCLTPSPIKIKAKYKHIVYAYICSTVYCGRKAGNSVNAQ